MRGSVGVQAGLVQYDVILPLCACAGGTGSRADVGYVIRARVVAIEKIEEFDEGDDRPTVVEVEGAGDAEIDLDVGSSAELIESGLTPLTTMRSLLSANVTGERSRAFGLSHGGKLESAGDIEGSGENEAGGDVLAGGAVVAGAEGIERIADAVDIVEEFSEHAAPGLRLRQRIVRDQVEAVGDVALQVEHQRVVAGAIVGFENVDVGNEILVGGVGSRTAKFRRRTGRHGSRDFPARGCSRR